MDEEDIKTGQVIAVTADKIIVRVDKPENDCQGCTRCPMAAICRGREAKHMDLPVPLAPNRPAPAIGETVRIEYHGANQALAALVLFVPALAGLGLGGVAGNRLGGDFELVLGCILGVAAGVLVTYLLSRAIPSLRPEAKLVD